MFSVANVSITVSYVGSVHGELGFIQPTLLKNQDSYQVTCTILGGSDTFILKGVNNEKDCGLFLTSALDRESRDTYELTVTAQSKALTETGRKKRQAMYTWAQSRIVITVGDVNDNTPQWVHVSYPRNTVQPPDGTQGIFITAVDHSAPTETVAIQLKATDSDMGLNGEVKYVLDVPAASLPPFRIDHTSGALLTKEVPPQDRTSKVLPYEITAVAYDLGVEQEGSKYVRAKCFINLIRDINRFVMTVTDKDYAQVISDKEIYRIALQQASNFVIIIERIEAKRDSRNGGIDLKSTDIVFLAAATMAPYQLINNTDTNAASLLTSAQALARVRDAFHGSPSSTAVDVVPLAYSRDSAVLHVLTKSYIWWMDDPWAALIALAAIISLLSVVGIIVLEFTYARYMNYITVYRKHLHYLPTRPESETQASSITMFIPVEEADIQYNEIEMKIDTSQLEATHAHKTDHPVSATEKKLTTDSRLKPIPDITISAVQ
ncbi:hypothetical protein Btru_025384 [Bulinus truncatus]|nr:hypothetical protein Btru_025384 [Bulinus truncatus]